MFDKRRRGIERQREGETKYVKIRIDRVTERTRLRERDEKKRERWKRKGYIKI